VLCIPDFVLHVATPVAGQPPDVIVETMGYNDDTYRDRKRRTHVLMRAALDGALLLEDDPSDPAASAHFRRRLIATLLEGIPRPVPNPDAP
jgi:hypothetical protein